MMKYIMLSVLIALIWTGFYNILPAITAGGSVAIIGGYALTVFISMVMAAIVLK